MLKSDWTVGVHFPPYNSPFVTVSSAFFFYLERVEILFHCGATSSTLISLVPALAVSFFLSPSHTRCCWLFTAEKTASRIPESIQSSQIVNEHLCTNLSKTDVFKLNLISKSIYLHISVSLGYPTLDISY